MVMRRQWLIVLGLLTMVGCTGEPDNAPNSPSVRAAPRARLEPSCPPAPASPVTIASAEAANTLLASQNLPAWDAADIGASTLLNDGRVVWVFGDTLRSDMTPGLVANSMLVSGGKCASQLLPAQDGPVIPDAKNGDVYWPMSALSWDDSGRERLVVLCARTRRGTSGDPLDFAFVAPAAALFEVPPGGAPQLQDVIQVAKTNPDPHQINWGAASFHDRHWIYIYGTRLTGEQLVFGRELYAARVPLASPEDLSTWRYWDSSDWQPKQSRATAVLGAEGGVSQTLSVDDLGDGRYLAVSKRDGDLGDFIYSWSAPSPAGPWTPHKGVPAPNDLKAGLLKYAPLAHPQIPLGNGMLLVAVSRNTTDPQRLLDDPDLGVVEFVEVALP